MPQEAWVLKCYLCNKYQVQLKKKAKKWQCKVCGAKQDLITIFYKGQPSDCRINVQNMNSAEGEISNRIKEQSCYKSQNCSIVENFSQSSHNCNEFSDDHEDFTDEVMAELNEKCNQVEYDYSQNIIKSQDYDNDCFESNELENTESSQKIFCESSEDFENQGSEKIIGTNLNDLENGISDNHADIYEKQEVKPSIFENNCESYDFDDHLDF